ncbi:MAG: PrsW family intramembrane metalloprotease, partial [Candidatus Bipolaricaulota bacterium]
MTLFVRSIYLASFLSLAYIFVLYRGHPWRRLPPPPVLLAFAAGMLSVLPVLLVHQALPATEGAAGGESAFVVAGIEEGLKLVVGLLLVWRWRSPEVIEPIDLAVYFAVFGTGFAVLEDLWYIFGATRLPWLAGDLARFRESLGFVVLARAFPGHILFGAFAGLLVGRARFARGRGRTLAWLAGALAVGVVLHAAFNMIAADLGQIVLLIYVVVLTGGLVATRRWAAERSPFRSVIEVATGAVQEGGAPHSGVELLLADGF